MLLLPEGGVGLLVVLAEVPLPPPPLLVLLLLLLPREEDIVEEEVGGLRLLLEPRTEVGSVMLPT